VQTLPIETVIILSPSHRHGFEGCSIYQEGGYKTPLGVAQIDEALARKLADISGFRYVPEAHQREHAVEVQVPFIQTVFPKAKIIPVVMGFPRMKTISKMADSLTSISDKKKILVVVSSDMSHFFPKEKANRIDKETISLIENFKTSSLLNKLERGENIMCGGGPVVCALLYSQNLGNAQVKLLGYADSSDAGGKTSSVVGYFSAAVTTRDEAPQFTLSREEKKELIEIAKRSIATYVQEMSFLDYHPQSTALLAKKGAFVTLKKNGHLRGCVGFVSPVLPLFQTVIQAAVYSACKDSRFPPVTDEELDLLEVEISILSPLHKIDDPKSLSVGKHGLMIVQGKKSGLLLPQVALENNWSRKEFLQQTCLKAGLPQDAWKKGAEVFVFEAILVH
jgi:AmmeMemoRadiSam system protein B/AmmeMemoRadiSam system protein A